MTTSTGPTATPAVETRQVSLTIPASLADRLDRLSERHLIGRNLIAQAALVAIVNHLEAQPDPLANLRIGASPAPA